MNLIDTASRHRVLVDAATGTLDKLNRPLRDLRLSVIDQCNFRCTYCSVNSLKGVSSRMIRQKNYPSIRRKLWGGALWSPSYFAGSCRGAPITVVRQHIEQQQTPH